jgi:hypothetical protein
MASLERSHRKIGTRVTITVVLVTTFICITGQFRCQALEKERRTSCRARTEMHSTDGSINLRARLDTSLIRFTYDNVSRRSGRMRRRTGARQKSHDVV